MFYNFRSAYEKFESWHLRQRGKLLRAKYERGLNGIYADLRKQPRDRLDRLHATFDNGVLATEANQVHVDASIPTTGASHWQYDGVPIKVTVLNEVVLQTPTPCQPGDVLTQHQIISDVPSLHRQLQEYWTPIWNAMQDVPPADWQRIINFFEAHVPKIGFDLPKIDIPTWRRALRRYKSTAARGVDGISHFDLQAMPDAWVSRLLTLLHRIECNETPWPTALLYGVVSVIAKDVNSATVDRFRPFVIFPVIYRTWASIRSSQMLRLLAPYMDSGAFGFLPGCETSQLWMTLQSDIECALQEGSSMVGLSTDLVRACNNIPPQGTGDFGMPLRWGSFFYWGRDVCMSRGQVLLVASVG
jgi:hypothetical protein